MLSGDHIAVGTIPTGWPFFPFKARMSSGSKLLPKAMFQSIVQLQLGSVLISVVSVISGGLKNHVR